MGTRKREHRLMTADTIRRVREAGGEHAVERWKSLRRTPGCAAAGLAQAREMLRLGPTFIPVECPHCGQPPDLESALAGRKPCAEIGHPEQAFRVIEGIPLVRCALCGQTPTPRDTGASANLAAMMQIMGANGVLPELGMRTQGR